METNKLKWTTFCRRQFTSDQKLHLFTYSTIFIWGWGWECNENLCQLKRPHDSLPHDTRTEFIIHSKPGFLMSRKSQTIGDFTVSRPSQILPTNENSKSKIFPIVRDGRGQIWRIGSVLFSRCVTDFCDGRRSFPTNENSNLYRRERLRWISLITNPLNCLAPAPSHK